MTAAWGAEAVSVRFGRTIALDAITWQLRQGGVSAVVGPDGAGKSTLMRVLVGTVRPDSGSVRRPPARRVGYVPARGGVFDALTVEENLGFVASAFGLGAAEARARREELLASSGLQGARERRAAALSGGMARKLAFAMAVLARPSLLVLDEPTTGLDPVSRTELWRLVAAEAAAGTAVAMSTSYLDDAERAESVLVLDDGSEIVSGDPRAVVAAMPGALRWSESRPTELTSWRVGRRWKVWDPGAAAGSGDATPTLEDAVIVAEMARAGGSSG